MLLPLPLCHVDNLREGEALGFDPQHTGQATVFAIRYRDEIYLWRNHCPHLGTPLNWRKNAFFNASRDRLVCFAHGALFEPDSGVCVQGACLGQRLTPLAWDISAEGWLRLTEYDDETGNTG
ncbi:Rieske (2Fe-2S) protein [Citrobacter rodentium]|jgi:Ferredoxin subunits of nitrite reductase and ring-hydroxylating dioxygenases|uniref:Rieske (2Fe-2S) protein n=1 Tax=Citrobacter rodentium TaxID=67825 RepID=A0A482PJV8_CITRO|nr:Rieske (2Fe-2S) protein [Citrobacter rodentium]KIQ48620.1 (2Fe-2S)-binding protein [Citrobacter rodentium]QBY28000.1 Rieske (2Fe-2S) protein [Citrobacter rodentium]UHO30118.1 Rieske (2Fe-2S) protein [Citrobacter rodentium NBRC 105723 = DSM 16636]HAT8014512.1 Rieske (2Fe-2S) protein [Citrobacter rodentium NBRC 105723 = DSM 16636]HAT8019371.1 Rieske (2Fe-2S) protein [Citrobacter rodentium]